MPLTIVAAGTGSTAMETTVTTATNRTTASAAPLSVEYSNTISNSSSYLILAIPFVYSFSLYCYHW
jgi:hypothetical protein